MRGAAGQSERRCAAMAAAAAAAAGLDMARRWPGRLDIEGRWARPPRWATFQGDGQVASISRGALFANKLQALLGSARDESTSRVRTSTVRAMAQVA